MSQIWTRLERALDDQRRADLTRRLITPRGVDMSSNDYLGLARDPAVLAALERRLGQGLDAIGAPASRLLRGHTDLHAQLEAKLARWKGVEAALLMASGWQANHALIGALVRPGDRVLSDRLNHASLIDAMRASRAKREIYPHLDLDHLALLLDQPHDEERQTFVVTESYFSMDGDIANLGRLADLCDAAGASLIVDDAHAAGLWGEARGSGLLEHWGVEKRVAAVIWTCGKALGTSGGVIGGRQLLIDYVVSCSRAFIFSTAVSPLVLHAIDAALEVLEAQPERRAHVHQLADQLRRALAERGVESGGEGPIVPVPVGDNRQAVVAAEALQLAGFDVRAIRPPTVPRGSARLRVSVHADHSSELVDQLADAIATQLTPKGMLALTAQDAAR